MYSKKLIKELEKLLKNIGSKLLKNFKFEKAKFYEKTPNEIVSEFDLEINNVIIRFIKKKYPGHNIISEESDHKILRSEYCWIIDPLDGSRNFINKVPFFCISIAIKKNQKTIAGFIYDPIQNEFFYSFLNKGAFLNGRKLSNKINKVSGIMLTETPKKKSDVYLKQRKLIKNNFKIRQLGSSALDIAYIATNRADIFWQENLNSWDYAAGLIIAKEANMKIINKKIKKNHLLIVHNKNLNKNFLKKFLKCFN